MGYSLIQIFHSTISLPPQKVPFLKISDDVIARDLWFGAPPIKNPGYAYVHTYMNLFAE